MNTEQRRKILDLTGKPERSKQKLMTVLSRRFDASYQNAMSVIQSGRIGTPAVIRCDNRDKYDRSDFYLRYIMSNSGIFIDTCVHDIDLTFSFIGAGARPKSCHAIGTIALHKELAEFQDGDNAFGTIEWY